MLRIARIRTAAALLLITALSVAGVSDVAANCGQCGKAAAMVCHESADSTGARMACACCYADTSAEQSIVQLGTLVWNDHKMPLGSATTAQLVRTPKPVSTSATLSLSPQRGFVGPPLYRIKSSYLI